jgi:hypothetical protein
MQPKLAQRLSYKEYQTSHVIVNKHMTQGVMTMPSQFIMIVATLALGS